MTTKDKESGRGHPDDINRRWHQDSEPETDDVVVQSHNLNRLCLFKVGAGAVAFKVVLNAFQAGGMKYTPREDWNVLWARRVDPAEYASMNAYQRINHFPGTWGIGRKDLLHTNISAKLREYGKAEWSFAPPTFLIPAEKERLEKDAKTHPGTTYIVKPVASSCGKGIWLTTELPPMPKKGSSLVQRYIAKPYLINNKKFDLRIYAVVTSYNPLRLFVHDQGLVRFAAEEYKNAESDIVNSNVHLTNYSVNKMAALERGNADIKWLLSELQAYLIEQMGETAGKKHWNYIWEQVKDIVVKTCLTIEDRVTDECARFCRDMTGRGCFELFGFDMMLDRDAKVFLLEVNIMPSLATQGVVDKAVKSRLLGHLLTLIGVVPYNRQHHLENDTTSYEAWDGLPVGGAAELDRANSLMKAKSPAAFLASLTAAEKRVVVEAEEELARAGGFQRVFPTPDSYRYMKFMPILRVRNTILSLWEEVKKSCQR